MGCKSKIAKFQKEVDKKGWCLTTKSKGERKLFENKLDQYKLLVKNLAKAKEIISGYNATDRTNLFKAILGDSAVIPKRMGEARAQLTSDGSGREARHLKAVECEVVNHTNTLNCLGLLLCILLVAWYAIKAYRRRQRVNAMVAQFQAMLSGNTNRSFAPIRRNSAAYWV